MTLILNERFSIIFPFILCFCLGVSYCDSSRLQKDDDRKCREITLNHFPPDIFSNEDRKNGWIAVHIVAFLYLCGITCLVLQAYLVGGLRMLCDFFRVATDSARDTIVIFGTCSPEFFCSLIGVFTNKDGLGTGTVIGSCAVNSLCTLGIIGFLIKGPVKLSWYDLWRDNIFYLLGVTVLLWTTYDHKVRWQESLFLIAFYIIYLLFINYNQKVERAVRKIVLLYRTGLDEQELDRRVDHVEEAVSSPPMSKKISRPFSKSPLTVNDVIIEENSYDMITEQQMHANKIEDEEDEDDLEEEYNDRTPLDASCSTVTDAHRLDRISLCTEDGYTSGVYGYQSDCDKGYSSERTSSHLTSAHLSVGNSGWLSDGDMLSTSRSYGTMRIQRYTRQVARLHRNLKRKPNQGSFFVTLDLDNYMDGPRSPFTVPDKWYKIILWLVALPAICLFHITIPDCRKPKWKPWFPLTIFNSLLWVAFFSYCLMWIASVIGYTYKVPTSLMGFIFLSFGLSIVEIVGTYAASEAGIGFKAVYSIYGSNVFMLSINLGLVWLIKSFQSNPYILPGGEITYVNLCQLIIVLTPFLLQFTRWRLTKILAVVFLFLYGVFVSMIILFEYNIIGQFNPPIC